MVLAARTCVRCRKRPEHVSANGKRRSWCSNCLNTSNAQTKARNPAKYLRQRRNANLIRTFGITADEYDAMLAAQGGGCAICGATTETTGKYLAVDHDAATGRIRGILCENCNRGIGMLAHDPDRLASAIAYLPEGNPRNLLTRAPAGCILTSTRCGKAPRSTGAPRWAARTSPLA